MNAITYALEFFKHQKTEFFVMHAYQNDVYDHEKLVSREDFDEVLEEVRNQSQTNLDNLLQTVKKISPTPNLPFIPFLLIIHL